MILYFERARNGHDDRAWRIEHLKNGRLSRYKSVSNLNVMIEGGRRSVSAVLHSKDGSETEVQLVDVSDDEWLLLGSNDMKAVREAIASGWVSVWPSLARYVCEQIGA